MKEPKFAIGDIVTVKPLDELKREFGNRIETPCRFVESMYKFCGRDMEVIEVLSLSTKEGMAYYYRLKGGEDWNFDECVFDEQQFAPFALDPISISYEALF